MFEDPAGMDSIVLTVFRLVAQLKTTSMLGINPSIYRFRFSTARVMAGECRRYPRVAYIPPRKSSIAGSTLIEAEHE